MNKVLLLLALVISCLTVSCAGKKSLDDKYCKEKDGWVTCCLPGQCISQPLKPYIIKMEK